MKAVLAHSFFGDLCVLRLMPAETCAIVSISVSHKDGNVAAKVDS